MVAALAEHCPDLTFNIPAGGFNLWCQLPLNLESRDFLTEAGLRGVVFAPGELFYAGSGGENALRLNFSAQSEKQIWEAIARLGQALAALQSSSGERLEPERLAELLV
jgi:DNA-binding transcriptional MocR family regulator